MHWGNIGSAVAGAAALVIAIAALVRSPAALRDWRARQRAEADAAHEEAESIRLERRQDLSGWSTHGVNTYDVSLVATAAEFEQVLRGLKADLPANYVVLRLSTGRGQFNDVNQAQSLRQLVETEGRISRSPTTGELEALEAGLEKLSIPEAAYGRLRATDETPDSSKTG